MPKWLQKSLVVLFTVLTFGLVSPPQVLLLDQVKADNSQEADSINECNTEIIEEQQELSAEKNLQVNKEKWVQLLMKEAELQSYTKFGEKIKPQIENEFREVILPNIEKAIAEVAEIYPEDDLCNLAVTEKPGKGKSEKIFHIVDSRTGNDIIRFHVRRDHPPKQGYWFNFHYHTYHDLFQTHHELGSIYWAANTPPNWMS